MDTDGTSRDTGIEVQGLYVLTCRDQHRNTQTAADRFEIIKTSIIPGARGSQVGVEGRRITESEGDEEFPQQGNNGGGHGDDELQQKNSRAGSCGSNHVAPRQSMCLSVRNLPMRR